MLTPERFSARLDETLKQARAFAESRMKDRCRITIPGAGSAVRDPETGTVHPPAPVTIYEGICRVKSRDMQDQTLSVGEAKWSVTDVILSLPMDSPAPPVKAVVTITEVGPLSDPALLNSVFSVAGPLSKSTAATARRLHCKEV